jgi:protein-S-isoprenylcysteine O-methyltransferase Ste14
VKSLLYLVALAGFWTVLYMFSLGNTIPVLDNPFIVFALLISGAFLSARLGGRARLTGPHYVFNIGQSLAGGVLMGAGFAAAGLPELGNVPVMTGGVFYWTSFLLPHGLVYLAGMMAGGGVAALMQKIYYPRLKFTPLSEDTRAGVDKGVRIILPIFVALTILLAGKAVILDPGGRWPALAGTLMVVAGGFLMERSRICMGLLMKEIYFARTVTTLGKLLFVVLLLVLVWQAFGVGRPAYDAEISILTLAGSFMMGFGFMLADGCYMGSLWKAGQGNLGSFAVLLGVFLGAGASVVFQEAHIIGLQQPITVFSNNADWSLNAIKPGLALVFTVWLAAYFLERPDKVVKRGSRFKWLLSEAAIIATVLIIAYAPREDLPQLIRLLGLTIFYTAVGLYIWARISLGKYWGEAVVLRDGHSIVTEGPYRLVKHPIYLAVGASLTGINLLVGSLWGIAAACLFVVPTLYLRAREEQRVLAGLPGAKEYFSS